MTYYLCTLTYENGLSETHLSRSKVYFKSLNWCLACHELGSSGSNDHIHAMVKFDKAGYQFRRDILKNIYGMGRNEDINPHMLKVEKVKNIPATVRYISKDVKSNYFLKVGVPIPWLQDQLTVAHVNKKWYTKWKNVPINQAPGCIIDYIKVHDIKIHNKEDFIEVYTSIAKYVDTSKWTKSIKWIYSQTMLLNGDDDPMRKMIENELHFI